MTVGFQRPEFVTQTPRWTLVRDCISGQPTIKSKTTAYLPKPNADDTSEENRLRYLAYLERAVFYGVTKRTLDGLIGQVFMREPIVNLPPPLDELTSNIDGAGVSLDQQAKKCLSEVMGYGRCGLLTDFPPTTEVVTAADIDDGYIRPTISLYEPWEIINWRTILVGGKEILSLVVLVEQYIEQDDGFEVKYSNQWRVLRLTYTSDPVTERIDPATLQYIIEIWRDHGPDTIAPVQTLIPRDATGLPLKEIPFTFVGAMNNDSSVDQAPLYDLAALNIAHYRNSADYEESCYITGQPTPYFAGLTEHWVQEVWKGSVRLGSRAAIPLPEGGTAGLLQASPNTMPFEAMQHKERQMVALGAKLVEQKKVQRSLGEAQMEGMSETSILAAAAKNVSLAYESALEWCAAFLGVDEEAVEFELNTDFPAARMTAEERAQLMAEWQGNAISFSEMRDALRKAGVASLNEEEAKDEIEEDPGNLAAPPPVPVGGNSNGRTAPRMNGKTQP
jgi:hypothetical protein